MQGYKVFAQDGGHKVVGQHGGMTAFSTNLYKYPKNIRSSHRDDRMFFLCDYTLGISAAVRLTIIPSEQRKAQALSTSYIWAMRSSSLLV